MTLDMMERELTNGAQASTETLLKEQLKTLKRLIDSNPDQHVLPDLVRMRKDARNLLCALTLRDDPKFVSALRESVSEVLEGTPPTGVVTREELKVLLDL